MGFEVSHVTVAAHAKGDCGCLPTNFEEEMGAGTGGAPKDLKPMSIEEYIEEGLAITKKGMEKAVLRSDSPSLARLTEVHAKLLAQRATLPPSFDIEGLMPVLYAVLETHLTTEVLDAVMVDYAGQLGLSSLLEEPQGAPPKATVMEEPQDVPEASMEPSEAVGNEDIHDAPGTEKATEGPEEPVNPRDEPQDSTNDANDDDDDDDDDEAYHPTCMGAYGCKKKSLWKEWPL